MGHWTVFFCCGEVIGMEQLSVWGWQYLEPAVCRLKLVFMRFLLCFAEWNDFRVFIHWRIEGRDRGTFQCDKGGKQVIIYTSDQIWIWNRELGLIKIMFLILLFTNEISFFDIPKLRWEFWFFFLVFWLSLLYDSHASQRKLVRWILRIFIPLV